MAARQFIHRLRSVSCLRDSAVSEHRAFSQSTPPFKPISRAGQAGRNAGSEGSRQSKPTSRRSLDRLECSCVYQILRSRLLPHDHRSGNRLWRETAMAVQLLIFLFLLFSSAQATALQAEDPVTTVSIMANAGLQYDLVRFKVKPGATVKIIFTNKDDMSHNLVFSKPGTREHVVNEAMKLEENGPLLDYIPKSSDVLWALPVLAPGEIKSITFTAPTSQGIYPYVCTFPGHGFSMYGAMYVTRDENLPDIQNDLNVPPSRRQTDAVAGDKNKNHTTHMANGKPLHPYEPIAPYLYRAYMEDASPAAIAVHLPHQLSYCWDAGTCQLRYAWQGGFIDNSGLWKGKPNAEAKILGTVFFREKLRYPLRIGRPEEIPVAEYKGYQLINRYPEFHYTLNGIDVYERIQPKEGGNGLIRTFRIPECNESVWFFSHAEDGIEYETSVGKWENNKLRLSSAEARKFTIVMTKSGE